MPIQISTQMSLLEVPPWPLFLRGLPLRGQSRPFLSQQGTHPMPSCSDLFMVPRLEGERQESRNVAPVSTSVLDPKAQSRHSVNIYRMTAWLHK